MNGSSAVIMEFNENEWDNYDGHIGASRLSRADMVV